MELTGSCHRAIRLPPFKAQNVESRFVTGSRASGRVVASSARPVEVTVFFTTRKIRETLNSF